MKRRGFMRLLGAASLAPFLPAPAVASTLTYSRTSFGMAVLHARTRAHVSARGLAFRLKIPTAQAEAMIAEMTKRGMVRPVGMGASVRAVSSILQPQPWHVATQHITQNTTQTHNTTEPRLTNPWPSDPARLPGWLKQVRRLARLQGHSMKTARLA